MNKGKKLKEKYFLDYFSCLSHSDLETPKPEPGYPKPGFTTSNPNPGFTCGRPGFSMMHNLLAMIDKKAAQIQENGKLALHCSYSIYWSIYY